MYVYFCNEKHGLDGIEQLNNHGSLKYTSNNMKKKTIIQTKLFVTYSYVYRN